MYVGRAAANLINISNNVPRAAVLLPHAALLLVKDCVLAELLRQVLHGVHGNLLVLRLESWRAFPNSFDREICRTFARPRTKLATLP